MKMITECYVGRHYTELPTPCLLLDLDAVDHNIKTMQEYLNENTKCQLRPHIKTHKCPTLAHLQIRAGAVGVTCAKLGEAVVMAHSGIRSILIANQVVGDSKIKVLAGLNRYGEVMPAVDNRENVERISHWAKEFGVEIPLFIEVSIGIDRCGVRTIPEALELAEHIKSQDNVFLKGIQAYENRGDECRNDEEKMRFVEERVGFAAKVKETLEDKGYPVEIMSSASTGTVKFTALYPGVTEVQPGSYVQMENAYDSEKIGLPFKQALYVLATVCSMYKERLVLTAGEKCVTIDQGQPVLVDDPQAKTVCNEEHCLVDMTDKLRHYKVGDHMLIKPAHCCTTVNQHDNYFCIRNGIVEDVWPIAARGRYD
ncbi:MAG: alanine racemase domain protein [Firmicutes bacterium]|nr:alanine racemase domain protein [Bacillota bacterium]